MRHGAPAAGLSAQHVVQRHRAAAPGAEAEDEAHIPGCHRLGVVVLAPGAARGRGAGGPHNSGKLLAAD